MAVKKGTREKSLFNGYRRPLKFDGGAKQFVDPQGNPHVRVKCRMPLFNESVLGMPEFVGNTYTAMQKDTCAETSVDFDRYMQGMAVAFYNGATAKTKQLRLTGCELDKFSTVKEGEGDSVTIELCFQMDVQGSAKELYDYMWDHYCAPIHVEFDYNQADLPLDATKEEAETQPNLSISKPGKSESEKVAAAKKTLSIM